MAIGRTEGRDTPRDPVMLQHRKGVRNPIRETHLGQRSIEPHTQAGHMTAIDQTRRSQHKLLAAAGAVHTCRVWPCTSWLVSAAVSPARKTRSPCTTARLMRGLGGWVMS